MVVTLGLDIGSNSVGSAWIDTEARTIQLGVSVFPSGVDESDQKKRGAPKNQDRRQKRSLRRNIARRAIRKHELRVILTRCGLLPEDPGELAILWNSDPWVLRRRALDEPLHPHEFGRLLVHLNQRRGAIGVRTGEKDGDEGKVKEAIDSTRKQMQERDVRTFGELITTLMDERRVSIAGESGKFFHVAPVRNRRDSFEHHADRSLIRDEFNQLWKRQESFDGRLKSLLTDALKQELDTDDQDRAWRHKGAIFGQRRTFWKINSLGRCDLEPTEHRCPQADMYAQEFRVIETVNNIRVEERGKPSRSLTAAERDCVIEALSTSKSGTVPVVRRALGLHKKHIKEFVALNIERDSDREINTNWFHREIVGAIGAENWARFDQRMRDSVNRAILKFDPDQPGHAEKILAGAAKWWNLDETSAGRLVAAWQLRPRIDKRIALSRRAVRNLLPYMNRYDEVHQRWPTQIEARIRFAEDRSNGATYEQRLRYDRGGQGLTKRDRQFLRKHPDLLPPAPTLSNPVVRKAIHEVRRHVIAYIRRFQRKPDRIVIELAREAKQPAKVRDRILNDNRKREVERKQIIEDFGLASLPSNQQNRAVERVRLCREQRGLCAYSGLEDGSGKCISEKLAAEGTGLEIDHIVPWSRSFDNSANNKVLCYVDSNRDKSNRTPAEWLSAESFARLEQRFEHWKKEHPRKWENLHRQPEPGDEFSRSQLTDTAYAARQVAQYLREALYSDDMHGNDRQRIFFTKGMYTALLRREWQLVDTDGPKERSDHRHHAVDALVIALTEPRLLNDLARHADAQERARARQGSWPKRAPVDPPWGDVDAFRAAVLAARDKQVVCHRPVKRKIVGPLHKDTQYGPVIGPLASHRRENPDVLFTDRVRVENLDPNHLRVPEGWDALHRVASSSTAEPTERRAARKALAALPDPSPGKSGIVRDRTLRGILRECLRSQGVDPDDFTQKDAKRVSDAGAFRMASGVPIRSAVRLRTINDPIRTPRKKWDPATRSYVHDLDARTVRVYDSQNNHHIEIRESLKNGKWSGEVVPTFEAARRAKSAGCAVDRSDHEGSRFVMSLAEGETVIMRHPVTNIVDYFVVFKLDKPQTVHFIHHWDARPAGSKDGSPQREDVAVTVSKLKALGPDPGSAPRKVRLTALGEIYPLTGD